MCEESKLFIFALCPTKVPNFRLRYFIELSYNGKAYHGWQIQPNAISVQEVLENALTMLLNEKIAVLGAGRTDTGVHAKQMFAHFDLNNDFDEDQLIYKLNAFLPKDIAIQQIRPVQSNAHARFDALSRTYSYQISLKKDPFTFESAYLFKQDLDIEKMNEASHLLFNYKNFKSFSRSNTDVKTYNCKIMQANWILKKDHLTFTIKADRFLRNMVRAIVGTLLDVGMGKVTLDEFKAIIESEDRTKAGASAPGQALYLTEIEYPEYIYNL